MPLTPDDESRLCAQPLFAALSAAQWQRLRPQLSEQRLDTEQHLFYAEQEAENFYLLLEGRVKLYRLSAGGNEKVIELIAPGQTFAEALMFLELPTYPVNAQALEDSRVVAVSNRAMLAILAESTTLCFKVMGGLSVRLHGLLAEVDALALQNATLRVVSYLLVLLPAGEEGECEVVLPAAKHVIASRLSIQPETLSRIFATLAREGLIEVHGLQVTVRDRQALRQRVNAP
ncbi:MAG: Crp/Fnr family transcriptional regulator [Pseudomonadota bacterium]